MLEGVRVMVLLGAGVFVGAKRIGVCVGVGVCVDTGSVRVLVGVSGWGVLVRVLVGVLLGV